jgi:hypothetical protein
MRNDRGAEARDGEDEASWCRHANDSELGWGCFESFNYNTHHVDMSCSF